MYKRTIILHLLLFVIVAGVIGFNGFLLYRVRDGGSDNDSESIASLAKIKLAVITAEDCKECFDINKFLTTIREVDDIKVIEDNSYDKGSRKGKKLIKQYEITQAPTVLISGDVEKIFDLASFAQNMGRRAEDGTLIVTNVPPPYLELKTGEVRGKFTAVYLTDKACARCYDTKLHQDALSALWMVPTEEKFIDRSGEEGGQLIKTYKITQAPTLLLKGELDLYPQLQQVWPAVGTIEKDGTYVFRNGIQQMGNYYDLEKDKLVEVELK